RRQAGAEGSRGDPPFVSSPGNRGKGRRPEEGPSCVKARERGVPRAREALATLSRRGAQEEGGGSRPSPRRGAQGVRKAGMEQLGRAFTAIGRSFPIVRGRSARGGQFSRAGQRQRREEPSGTSAQ